MERNINWRCMCEAAEAWPARDQRAEVRWCGGPSGCPGQSWPSRPWAEPASEGAAGPPRLEVTRWGRPRGY